MPVASHLIIVVLVLALARSHDCSDISCVPSPSDSDDEHEHHDEEEEVIAQLVFSLLFFSSNTHMKENIAQLGRIDIYLSFGVNLSFRCMKSGELKILITVSAG